MAGRARATRYVEGIVLHLGQYGEAHRLVEVLCREQGRLSVVAHGARASRRRFAGVLEVFGQLRLQVQGGVDGGLGTLVSAELLRPRAQIRRDLPRISRASALCACVRHLCPEQQGAPEAFALLQLALDHVAAGEVARAAGAYPRLAQAAGIMPDLNRCGRCGAAQSPLVRVDGQVLLACRNCSRGGTAMSAAVHAALGGARVTDVAVANAVEDIVLGWTAAHSGRALHVLTRGDGD